MRFRFRGVTFSKLSWRVNRNALTTGGRAPLARASQRHVRDLSRGQGSKRSGRAEKPKGAGPRRSGPVDPRLLQYTRGTRRYLFLTVVLGGVTAGLVLAQAWLIAHIVSDVVVHHQGTTQVRLLVVFLACVIFGRALVAWLGERAAQRSSAVAKSDLRTALVQRIVRLGPAGIDRERSGRLVVMSTSGIDALDSYFARYLPQLFLAVIVPVAIIVVVSGADWISALIIAVTVPLIPLFMALVGASTKARMRRQARLLQRLAGHFLDVVAGLPTLKIFGRAKAQVAAVRDITDRYRTATMSTLKVAFLSSLILELLATFSVALVAVAVGLRLLGGHLTFATALFVLILAPEAYLPLRLLGTNYHASAEGMKAAEDIFEVLERPESPHGSRRDVPDVSASSLRIDGLEVRYPDRTVPALRDVSLCVEPGEVVAIAGPSGCGKSSLLAVLLGLVPASCGSVAVGGVDLAALDPDAWRARVAWVPQRPHLFARSIADNVRLGRPDASDYDVRSAISDAGLDDVVAGLPEGLATVLGADGAGLSAGERQRVALARAFLRNAPLLLLDEPTASLDGATEETVLSAVRRLVVGRTVVMAAHRRSLLAISDRVIRLAPVAQEAVAS
jgi:thiol reductant ABC exporter CydD subunit